MARVCRAPGRSSRAVPSPSGSREHFVTDPVPSQRLTALSRPKGADLGSIISAPVPTSPIVWVRFPRSAPPTWCHGAAAWPSSPSAASVWAFRHAANPRRSPSRSGSAHPCGSRCSASAGFPLAPWCPVAAAWKPPRDALDGYGRSAAEVGATARRVLAPRREAWPYPARARRPTSRGRVGPMWTRRKCLGLACSTFTGDRLKADWAPSTCWTEVACRYRRYRTGIPI